MIEMVSNGSKNGDTWSMLGGRYSKSKGRELQGRSTKQNRYIDS